MSTIYQKAAQPGGTGALQPGTCPHINAIPNDSISNKRDESLTFNPDWKWIYPAQPSAIYKIPITAETL